MELEGSCLLTSFVAGIAEELDWVCSYSPPVGELFSHDHNLALVYGALLYWEAKTEAQVQLLLRGPRAQYGGLTKDKMLIQSYLWK